MKVNAAYVEAVANWSEKERVEVPENAIMNLAARVSESYRSCLQIKPMVNSNLSDLEILYLTAEDEHKDFLEKLPELTPAEHSLLGRTIEKLEIPYKKEATLLFGFAKTSQALQPVPNPSNSEERYEAMEQAYKNSKEIYLALPDNHPNKAKKKAKLEKMEADMDACLTQLMMEDE